MKPCTRFSSVKNNLQVNPVVENLLLKQFQIKLDNERNALINYEKIDDNTYDLVHSFVPEEYQGMGLGHILAQRIFDHLISEHKKIKLSCEFLQKFYEKNCEKYEEFVLN